MSLLRTDDGHWAPIIARVQAISYERTRRDQRRARLALLWKLPALLTAGGVLGVAAAMMGLTECTMSLIMATTALVLLTFLGAMFGGAANDADWEAGDEPLSPRRIAVGAAAGFAAGTVLFFLAVRA